MSNSAESIREAETAAASKLACVSRRRPREFSVNGARRSVAHRLRRVPLLVPLDVERIEIGAAGSPVGNPLALSES